MLNPAFPSETTPAKAVSDAVGAAGRERTLHRTLRIFASIVAFCFVAAWAVALWARNALTAVEAIVGVQCNMFANGQGLYWNLNAYPYTIAAYGPIYYSLTAACHRLTGLPVYSIARTISFLALIGALWSGWRILRTLIDVKGGAARTAGLLLAAATANLLYWGTSGQVDMLAISFSMAAFASYLEWRDTGRSSQFWLSAAFVVAAMFTKQTAISAGTTISVMLLWQSRRADAWRWIAAVCAAGLAIAGLLQWATHGHYLDNALFANLNPFAFDKLAQQANYFVLTAGGLVLAVLCGLRGSVNARTAPLFVYTGLASAVWLLTAPKVGSDLNYQLEMTLLLALATGVVLDRTGFFDLIYSRRQAWITMLQIPLMLHVVLNLCLMARNLADRALLEPVKAGEIEALRPYMAGPEKKRVLAAHYDAVMQLRGSVEVETLIYTLLVEAGRVDGGPVLRDLEAQRFDTVVLTSDVFQPRPEWLKAESAALPEAHIDAVRRRYRLVKHIPGAYLNGDYIYEPKRD